MADAAHHDPNAAPMHHDIVDDFKAIHVAICAFMGAAAIILGTVLGLVLIND